MKPYQINELERLTGIKAHTIRIWEKRYNLISPLRTDTNRRYYSDDEVRKLLNVSTLLSCGYKISKVATLDPGSLSQLILSLPQKNAGSKQVNGRINELMQYTLAFEEQKIGELFDRLVSELGVYETVTTIIFPFLQRVGIFWSAGNAESTEEHFASAIIRSKLMSATNALPPTVQPAKTFLLFLPEGEWHDIGLLLANYIIRSKGCKTFFLGQNNQMESLEKSIPAIKPDYLLLFYITNRPLEEIEQQLKFLAECSDETKILVAGNQELFPAKKSTLRNVTYLRGVPEIFPFLE